MKTVKLSIEGMSCGHCVSRVSAALSALDGVKVERVSVGTAEVSLDPGKSSSTTLVEALARIGYPSQASSRADDSSSPSGASNKQSCCCCHKP